MQRPHARRTSVGARGGRVEVLVEAVHVDGHPLQGEGRIEQEGDAGSPVGRRLTLLQGHRRDHSRLQVTC